MTQETAADAVFLTRTMIKDIATQAGWEIAGEAGNGVETLRALRREDPAARVVMVTAIDQRAKLSECIQLGAIDFVVKPFDRQRLMSTLQKYG